MNQNTLNMVLWVAVFFIIVYFIMIRPNSKQQKARRTMLDSLQVKDKVVTIGGLHGTISKINEDTVKIKVAPNVELEFTRTAIQSVENRDAQKDSGKNDNGAGKSRFFRKDSPAQADAEAKAAAPVAETREADQVATAAVQDETVDTEKEN
jgi:preprotein translocase subunit YajC